MPKRITEKSEIARLSEIYSGLSENQFAVVQGLIAQAARLRVQLDALNRDLRENGLLEMFSQSDKVEPYQRTRPAADLFVKLDKNYQAIIRQLNELTPPEKNGGRLAQPHRRHRTAPRLQAAEGVRQSGAGQAGGAFFAFASSSCSSAACMR